MKLKSVLKLSSLMIVGCVGSANAVSFSDNFDSYSGATTYTTGADVTAGWKHYPGANVGNGNTWSFPTISAGNNGYKMTSGPGTSSTNPGRVGSWYNAAGFTAIADFVVEADLLDWSPTFGQYMGLSARSTTPSTGFPNAYGLILKNDSSGPGAASQLQITRLDAFGSTIITPGNQGKFDIIGSSAAPAPAGDYRLQFWGVGANLYGKIYDKSTGLAMMFNNGSGGLTDIVSATDASYASGRTGLLGFIRTEQGVDPTYDNFFVSTEVPEPTIAALAGMGLASLAIFRRRQ